MLQLGVASYVGRNSPSREALRGIGLPRIRKCCGLESKRVMVRPNPSYRLGFSLITELLVRPLTLFSYVSVLNSLGIE